MKKTLIASAIAAVSFSGTAVAQTGSETTELTPTASELAAKLDSMPEIYGNIQLAVTHDNYDGGPSETNHFDNGSTIGVLHDHELAPGVEGFFKAEFHFDADDNNGTNDGIYEIDEAYVGVRGDNFGQIWVGKDDDTYERAVTVVSEYYEAAVLSQGVSYTTGEGDLIQYMSPSFGGLSILGAVQYNGDSDTKGKGEKSYPWQLAAVYEMGGLELAAAIDSNDGAGSNENTYGLRATYSLESLDLTAEYHTREDVQDNYAVQGVYTMGANRFAASYERTDLEDGSDLSRDVITLQALHNLSDHMYVWVEGYLGGGDDVWSWDDSNPTAVTDERSVAAVGAVYYF
ncbi:Outer membrane protein (porin) [Marinobacter daqiaonensis]|uniref:Outer membrane protein (Porin) n=1 Tax=Marinobacter daqiaonensis TaxID=650891 RepID=A0A1I6K1S3_9GAMM|nr:porin [Marinobacter daqiaonensis]SFR85161.1 Outer membrane protein (porin) [Marinobacter daqiaonensis]